MPQCRYLGSHHLFSLGKNLFFGSAAGIQLRASLTRHVRRLVFFAVAGRLDSAVKLQFVLAVVVGNGLLARTHGIGAVVFVYMSTLSVTC